MQRSLFWRPRRTCSGRSIFMSCIETLATRFARRCNSCSSVESRLTSNSSPNSDSVPATPVAGSISSSGSISGWSSSSAIGSSTTGAGHGGAARRAGAAGAAFGTSCEGIGRCGAGGASGATLPAKSVTCASIGDRAPVCIDEATNLESTSSVAASEAAEVCARSSDGSALVGLLLAQAETTSLTA